MGLGGFLDGYKTTIGGVLSILARLAILFPNLPFAHVLSQLESIGDILFSYGLVHWKIKDLVDSNKSA